MSAFGTLLKALLALVALLALIAFALPRTQQLQRSVTIDAPQAEIFDRLNTFQGFNEYSPWFERDPQAVYDWSGPPRGVGAHMSWISKKRDVGQGSQEITASEPYRHIVMHLDFGAGGQNEAAWTIEPQGQGSKVTWSLSSDAGFNPVNRWVGLFLQRIVGPDFERGLARLKLVAERAASKPAAASMQVEQLDVAAMDFAQLGTRAANTPDKAKIGAELARAYGVIGEFLEANTLRMAGPPLAITTTFDDKEWVFDAAVPVTGAPEALARAAKLTAANDAPASGAAAKTPSGNVRIGRSYAGKALRLTHLGPYASLPASYEQLQSYMKDHGLQAAGAPWEQYISDPANTPQDKLLTYLYWPVK